jgi:hypothetical protein
MSRNGKTIKKWGYGRGKTNNEKSKRRNRQTFVAGNPAYIAPKIERAVTLVML